MMGRDDSTAGPVHRDSVGRATVGRGWARVAQEVMSGCGVALALGAVDSGKSSFLFWLARRAAEQGRRVWLVDADVGQSDVGPPCAISAAPVTARFTCAAGSHKPEVPLVAPVRFFVGSSSPAGHLLACVTGVSGAVTQARAHGADLVLVNTTGYVRDGEAVTLKVGKIDAVRPDVVLTFGPPEPLLPILAPYRHARTPRVLHCSPAPGVSRRSTQTRVEARTRAWRQYLEVSERRWIDLAKVGSATDARAQFAARDLRGRVVGLFDENGACAALGVVTDQRRRSVEVQAPLSAAVRVARLELGTDDLSGRGVI